jgi:hypothetical protein
LLRYAEDKHGKFVGFDEETQRVNGAKGVAPVLRCYHALGVQKVVGGRDPNPKVFPPGTPASMAAAAVGAREKDAALLGGGRKNKNKKSAAALGGSEEHIDVARYYADKAEEYATVTALVAANAKREAKKPSAGKN